MVRHDVERLQIRFREPAVPVLSANVQDGEHLRRCRRALRYGSSLERQRYEGGLGKSPAHLFHFGMVRDVFYENGRAACRDLPRNALPDLDRCGLGFVREARARRDFQRMAVLTGDHEGATVCAYLVQRCLQDELQ